MKISQEGITRSLDTVKEEVSEHEVIETEHSKIKEERLKTEKWGRLGSSVG